MLNFVLLTNFVTLDVMIGKLLSTSGAGILATDPSCCRVRIIGMPVPGPIGTRNSEDCQNRDCHVEGIFVKGAVKLQKWSCRHPRVPA